MRAFGFGVGVFVTLSFFYQAIAQNIERSFVLALVAGFHWSVWYSGLEES